LSPCERLKSRMRSLAATVLSLSASHLNASALRPR
jgi:hypothetical protein